VIFKLVKFIWFRKYKNDEKEFNLRTVEKFARNSENYSIHDSFDSFYKCEIFNQCLFVVYIVK